MSFVFQANQNAVQSEKDAVNGFIKQHIAYPPDLVKTVCLYFYHQLLHPFAIIDNYDYMGLNIDLLRGVYSYGLERPSPVEQRLVVPILEGNDVLIQMTPRAPRRAVYTIPAIQIIDPGIPQCQTLVLALSREDAQIIYTMLRSLATDLSITSMTLVGGSSVHYAEDIDQTREGRQIIIGTPGKVNCMIQKGALKLNALKLLVVDDIDEMLDRGFREQLYGIMQELPMERTFHVALLTANINGDILSFSDRFQSNPIRLLKRNYDEITSLACMKSISHYFVPVEKEDLKLPTLYDLLECLDFQQVLIYCNTSERAKWLKHKLVEFLETKQQIRAIHEETKPQIRKEIAREFHVQSFRVLIATDCFHSDHAFGVINFDLPIAKEHYSRRIGARVKTCLWETYRTHCKQLVINFVTEEQETMYEELAAFYAIAVDELPMELDSM